MTQDEIVTEAMIAKAREILAWAYQTKGWPTSAAEILRGESKGEPNSAPMLAVLEALRSSTAQEPALDDDAEWLRDIGTGRLIDIEDAARIERIADRLQAKAPETGERP